MRRLPNDYVDLSTGFDRIGELNRRFQQEWGASISRWKQAADRDYALRSAATERARRRWETVQNQERPKKVIGCFLLLFPVTLICMCSPSSLFGGLTTDSNLYADILNTIAILFAVGLGGVGIMLYGRGRATVRRVANHLLQDPRIDFDPRRPRTLQNPMPPKRREVFGQADLRTLWWRRLDAEADQHREITKHGDRGELLLWDALNASLPDSYIAIRNLMVTDNLDIDLLLLGPTGIWALESKYVSGEIFFANGCWHQRQAWVGNGDWKPVDDYHSQWLRERNALERHLRKVLPGWDGVIQGGLVFTLADATLNIARDIPVSAGKTASWIRKILDAPAVPWMMEGRLIKAADSLLKKSASHEKQPYLSAARLADQVYAEQVEMVRAYADAASAPSTSAGQ